MYIVDINEFNTYVERSIAALPKTHKENIKNIAFIVEDEPSQEQRKKLNLSPNQTLFGLYEGVPLASRQGREKTLPDVITIFKKPIEQSVSNLLELKEQIYHTVWHEVAHYYGLDHVRIHELE